MSSIKYSFSQGYSESVLEILSGELSDSNSRVNHKNFPSYLKVYVLLHLANNPDQFATIIQSYPKDFTFSCALVFARPAQFATLTQAILRDATLDKLQSLLML